MRLTRRMFLALAALFFAAPADTTIYWDGDWPPRPATMVAVIYDSTTDYTATPPPDPRAGDLWLALEEE